MGATLAWLVLMWDLDQQIMVFSINNITSLSNYEPTTHVPGMHVLLQDLSLRQGNTV